jgi:hypothetical protein
VRDYIIDNALMWLGEMHVDGLRLDAVHALHESASSPVHILQEIAERVDALSAHVGRPLSLIAESDLNDPIMILPREAGGYGLTAQWVDDWHHAVHVALTGRPTGTTPTSPIRRHCPRPGRAASTTTARSRPSGVATGARPYLRRYRRGASSRSRRTTTRSATARPVTGSASR